MLKLFTRRTQLLRHGHIRLKATAPPRSPRADLASIPQAIRELLPKPQERDANAPPKKRRGPLFYLMLVSPLFIWIEVEKFFDPKPLLEKKRRRIMRERLQLLRETESKAGFKSANPRAVVGYLRHLFGAMLPPDVLRYMRSEEVCSLLEQDCPQELLVWLQEVADVTYHLSKIAEDEEQEVSTAENIQDSADGILRKCYQTVHQRLPPLTDLSPETALSPV